MPKTPRQTMNANDMHALVDRLLPPEKQRGLEDALSHDAHQQETVVAWHEQRAALNRLHREILTEPLPASMLQAASRIAALQRRSSQIFRWAGMAVSVILAFGGGWMSHHWMADPSFSPVVAARGVNRNEFVRQASLAHAVYLPEKRHPVEVVAAEQEHLVQWLSKRVGRPLKVPNLAPLGYELVGGRLLPGDIGARAQFMFQNDRGQRITLYLGLVEKQPDAGDLRETRFRYESGDGAPSFYWFDQGFGYALTGQVPRENLMALADAVFQQLWPGDKMP